MNQVSRNVFQEKRYRQGLLLYRKGNVYGQGFNQWKVQNQDNTKNYQVKYSHHKWTCNCPDNAYMYNKCKHIYAAQIYSKHNICIGSELTKQEIIQVYQKIEEMINHHPLESKIETMKTIIPGLMEVN